MSIQEVFKFISVEIQQEIRATSNKNKLFERSEF